MSALRNPIPMIASAAVFAVGALAVYLYLELDERSSALAETDAALMEQRTLYSTLETDYGSLAAAHADLAAANVTLEESLAAANAVNDGLGHDLRAASDANDSLTAQLASVVRDRDAVAAERDRMAADLEASRAAYAELESLHGQKAALEAEIADLHEQRKPLVLGSGATDRRGFYCTGSMAPTVTCVDEATWLLDFDPANIAVGTIIFYTDCTLGSGIVHRVIEIEDRGGVLHFRTQGDSNRGPDDCWTPAQDVDGYLVEIHRNVRPANIELRDAVVSAREAYDAVLDKHCGPGPIDGCSSRISRAVYDAEVKGPRETYQCWVAVAEDSLYPGHVPRRC